MRSAAHARRLLRALASGLAATTVGLIAAPIQASAAAPDSASSVAVIAPRPAYYSIDVLSYVNSYRQRAGAPRVTLNSLLNNAAIAYAADMASRQYMSHTGPGGTNAGVRITNAGYRWWIWGENVGAGQRTSLQAATSWYNSPSHRAIMLDPRYRHMGLGRVVAKDGTPYWCLLFATPR
jgi:uncharacterized protein YkwD